MERKNGPIVRQDGTKVFYFEDETIVQSPLPNFEIRFLHLEKKKEESSGFSEEDPEEDWYATPSAACAAKYG